MGVHDIGMSCNPGDEPIGDIPDSGELPKGEPLAVMGWLRGCSKLLEPRLAATAIAGEDGLRLAPFMKWCGGLALSFMPLPRSPVSKISVSGSGVGGGGTKPTRIRMATCRDGRARLKSKRRSVTHNKRHSGGATKDAQSPLDEQAQPKGALESPAGILAIRQLAGGGVEAIKRHHHSGCSCPPNRLLIARIVRPPTTTTELIRVQLVLIGWCNRTFGP
jgi:hypothetical protein